MVAHALLSSLLYFFCLIHNISAFDLSCFWWHTIQRICASYDCLWLIVVGGKKADHNSAFWCNRMWSYFNDYETQFVCVCFSNWFDWCLWKLVSASYNISEENHYFQGNVNRWLISLPVFIYFCIHSLHVWLIC